MLTVAVLGPVELRRDGAHLPLPGGKTTEVLIRLALDAGVLVRADRLIEDLWSARAVSTARNTLQSKVSQLRRVLGDPTAVIGGGAGYTLAVDVAQVDALRVLRTAESATALRQAGDIHAVLRTCTTGLAMFRGDILPGAGDGEWVPPWRARLEEARLRLTEDQLAARIDLGAAGELVGELESLVAVHPLREGLWTLLITALYRAGRQADALAAFRQVRHHLADELGLDPGAELRALEQRVLRHDEALDPDVRQVRATAAGRARPQPARGNLPGLSASLIGRQSDLAVVTELVAGRRLVTVVGPAGVGKTRLAIEVARGTGLTGGAWLVRLDAARTGAAAWQSIGEVFDVAAATEPMVLDRLRGAELLLALDNCEHLDDTVAMMVERMLGVAPGLRVLATSRRPLGLDGEAVVGLAPLTPADSVALFLGRAAQQGRSLVMDAEAEKVVAEICRSLDGLPLAIELAAARTKVLSVQEIARRLDDRFTLLNDPTGRRPARQRTLAAAIAWSYELLFPDDQRGLWALASFSGGTPLAAAEEVLAALGVPPASAVDVIGRLADRSLVSVDVSAGGTVRYRLLDSVRQFSLDRARDAGMADIARGAHAAWIAAVAARTAGGIRGPEQHEHVSVARTERANIDAALAWAAGHDPLVGLRIANGFGWAWAVLGAGADAARRIRAAVTAVDAIATQEELATGMLLAGWLEASGGDLHRADTDIEQAIRIADAELRSVGQLHQAFVRTQQGRPEAALALLAACRAEFHRLGRLWEEGGTWLLAAWAEIALGETDRGRAACDQALRLLTPLGDRWMASHLGAMLGNLALAEHRFTDAATHLRRAADAAHHLGFAAAEAYHLTTLARAQEHSGEPHTAITTLERAIDAALATGDLRVAAMARVRLGRLRHAHGDRHSARTAALLAHQWYCAAGGGDGAGMAEDLLAALDADEPRTPVRNLWAELS